MIQDLTHLEVILVDVCIRLLVSPLDACHNLLTENYDLFIEKDMSLLGSLEEPSSTLRHLEYVLRDRDGERR